MKLTVENIKNFLANIEENKADQYRFHPSEPRPAGDKHPEVKNLVVLTKDSFKELVLESDKDVLVYIHIPSYTLPVEMQILAQAFADDKDIIVAKYGSFLNEFDPQYFGDTPIEGVKLFLKGDKNHPITYKGKGDLLDLAAFVATNRREEGLRLYNHLNRANNLRLAHSVEKILTKYYMHIMAYNAFQTQSPHLREMSQQLLQMIDELTAPEDPYTKSMLQIKKEMKKELEEMERSALKHVRKIPKEKFDDELAEARKKGKVIVFFWRKGCYPCMKFNPLVGTFSEDFEDITILKVDADVMNLNATPTFFVYEQTGEPDQLSGRQLVHKMHQMALERGKPGYERFLPRDEKPSQPQPEEKQQDTPVAATAATPAAATAAGAAAGASAATTQKEEQEKTKERKSDGKKKHDKAAKKPASKTSPQKGGAAASSTSQSGKPASVRSASASARGSSEKQQKSKDHDKEQSELL